MLSPQKFPLIQDFSGKSVLQNHLAWGITES
jgi:hypothetical protein